MATPLQSMTTRPRFSIPLIPPIQPARAFEMPVLDRLVVMSLRVNTLKHDAARSLRTRKTRNCVSSKSGLSLMHQLAMSAQQRWRRLRGFQQLADVVAGIKFIDGIDERKISRKAA
jgi:hypothetical protein